MPATWFTPSLRSRWMDPTWRTHHPLSSPSISLFFCLTHIHVHLAFASLSIYPYFPYVMRIHVRDLLRCNCRRYFSVCHHRFMSAAVTCTLITLILTVTLCDNNVTSDVGLAITHESINKIRKSLLKENSKVMIYSGQS